MDHPCDFYLAQKSVADVAYQTGYSKAWCRMNGTGLSLPTQHFENGSSPSSSRVQCPPTNCYIIMLGDSWTKADRISMTFELPQALRPLSLRVCCHSHQTNQSAMQRKDIQHAARLQHHQRQCPRLLLLLLLVGAVSRPQ